MKNFLMATLKIAVALIATALAIALGWWAVSAMQDAARQRDAKPFEEVKTWTPEMHESLGMKMHVRTKMVSGSLHGQVALQGAPLYLTTPGIREANLERYVSIEFHDSDGFKLFERQLKLRDFVSIIGPDSKPTGFHHEFTTFLDLDTYKRWASVSVGWNVDTSVPTSAKTPSPADLQPVLDHCGPGVSRQERLKRLGQYGQVRETGYGTYEAGGRSMTVMEDGQLISCR